jgi:hypothetical protein
MIGCCPLVDEQLSAYKLSRLKAFLSEHIFTPILAKERIAIVGVPDASFRLRSPSEISNPVQRGTEGVTGRGAIGLVYCWETAVVG